jgi:hypothetical protein
MAVIHELLAARNLAPVNKLKLMSFVAMRIKLTSILAAHSYGASSVDDQYFAFISLLMACTQTTL